jgi:hypothetical protein
MMPDLSNQQFPPIRRGRVAAGAHRSLMKAVFPKKGTMMAMLFMLEQQLLYRQQYLLLSCFDIVSILSFMLPQRAITEKEVIR